MLDGDTIRKLREMKLGEVVDIVDGQERIPESYGLSFDERMKQIVDDLYLVKQGHRITGLVKRARFRWPNADVSSILYLPDRNLNRDMLLNLARCAFMQNALTITICGASSSGKSYLACALGKAACRQGYKVKYMRMEDLFSKLTELERKDARMRFANRLANYDLLILDEWLSTIPTENELNFIFELVEKRSEVHSTVISGLYEPASWCERMGSSAQSESIVERLIHTPINIDCGDFNMREHLARQSPKQWC
ncbi:MAG: ATP-binding protein [Sphaerochaetaceae bacterium]